MRADDNPTFSVTPMEALRARSASTPDAIALIADGRSWTCARLVADTDRLVGAMRARGVKTGDRVALHMFNHVEAVLAYLACWQIGALAVPLNTRYKSAELTAMVQRIRPVLYLGEVGLYEAAQGVTTDLLAAERRFVVGSDSSRHDARPWTDLATRDADASDPQSEDRVVDRDAPAVLLATSGTTGPSKLVVWTLRTLGAFAACAGPRGLAAKDTYCLFFPMMHASGVGCICECLLTGAVAVLVPSFEPEAVLDAVSEHRCTTIAALPFMFSQLARSQKSRPRNVASLRLCMAGGYVYR